MADSVAVGGGGGSGGATAAAASANASNEKALVQDLLAALEAGAIAAPPPPAPAPSAGGGRAAVPASVQAVGAADFAVIGVGAVDTPLLVPNGPDLFVTSTVPVGVQDTVPFGAVTLEQELEVLKFTDLEFQHLQQWWSPGFSPEMYTVPLQGERTTLQYKPPALGSQWFAGVMPEPGVEHGVNAFPSGAFGQLGDTPLDWFQLQEVPVVDVASHSSVLRPISSDAEHTEDRLRGKIGGQPFLPAGFTAHEPAAQDTSVVVDAVAIADAELHASAPGMSGSLTREQVVSTLGTAALYGPQIGDAEFLELASQAGIPNLSAESNVIRQVLLDARMRAAPPAVDVSEADATPAVPTETPVLAASSSVGAYASASNPAGLLDPYARLADDENAIQQARRRIAERQHEAERAAAAATPKGSQESKSASGAAAGSASGMPAFAELGLDADLWLGDDDEDDDDNDEDTGASVVVHRPGQLHRNISDTSARSGAAGDSKSDAAVDADGEPDDYQATLDAMLDATRPDVSLLRPKQGKDATGLKWATQELASEAELQRQESTTTPALTFPFRLDWFQRQAVYRLERGENVFVAAHTSAGKTVVAEYALALSAKHMTRCVYTSPIKALSNQKFRDFKEKFGDVGLITGDVSINPDASCLIMTTEILRSMLYRGADIVRDIEWVVFDEVHYVNDADRGVVWEEVIILLPEHVRMIFLSATTPNTLEFSEWIGRTKQRPVYVVSTSYRPVPLKHHLYLDSQLYLIMDPVSGFNSNGLMACQKAAFTKQEKAKAGGGAAAGAKSGPAGAGASRSSQTHWQQLIKKLQTDDLLPAVVFAFSKKLCEDCAFSLKTTDLTTAKEKAAIHLFLDSSIKRLQGTDRQLPQVLRMKELLSRGLGVHHGGLLPIIKEIVEILFSRGLVKVLFATETFAMGVNMPARTVVYNGIRKHDGKNFRELLPGEYTQMAGRAGRRGLDSSGMVIITCWADMPDSTVLYQMLTGAATKLESQFRLTYTMVLNLLRVEDMSVTDMMKRSFSEFRTQRALGGRDLPALLMRAERRLAKLTAKSASQDCLYGGASAIGDYYQTDQQIRTLQRAIMEEFKSVQSQLLCTGRLVDVAATALPGNASSANARSTCRAVVLTGPKGNTAEVVCLVVPPAGYAAPPPESKVAAPATDPFGGRLLVKKRDADDDMFGGGSKKAAGSVYKEGWFGQIEGQQFGIIRCATSAVTAAAATKVKVDPEAILSSGSMPHVTNACRAVLTSVQENPHYLPLPDPAAEFRLMSIPLGQAYEQYLALLQINKSSKCAACPRQSELWALEEKRHTLKSQIELLRTKLSNESLALFPDFQQRLSVLKALGYINEEGTVVLKGRVAAEVNTCNELVLTELVFENVLSALEPAEIASLLSCLVFQEKTEDIPTLPKRLELARDTAKRIASSLGAVQMQHGLEVIPEEFGRECVKEGLMECVYEWARGMPFKDICALTTIAEGTIVRTITRLDETCREVRNAARIIGDPLLYRKMEQTSELIKRDIVFATSLYLG